MNALVIFALVFLAYADAQTACGTQKVPPVFPFIVGGSEAVKGSYPWQANLRAPSKWNPTGYYQFCGGTLINDQWILTAGHCWYGTKDRDIPDHRIGLGYHHIDGDGDDEISTVQISKLFMHEGYYKAISLNDKFTAFDHINSHACVNAGNKSLPAISNYDLCFTNTRYDDNTLANDIALLKLLSVIPFNDYIRPACLPKDDTPVQDACTSTPIISGWGDTQDPNNEPNFLQQAQVPYIDTATCNRETWYNGEVLDEMFCAGFAQGGVDTCQGDSGGPLVCQEEVGGAFYVHGIVSWGYGCANPRLPGIYTRTAYFRNWINNIISSN